MKTIATLCLVLFALTSSANAQAVTPEPPVVVAAGEGVVKAVPDQAWVQIGSEGRSKSSKEAQARNAEAMTAVQQKMTALGIAKDAVRTVVIDLQMEYDYANGRQTPRGYVARHTIEVRVDDFARLGDVLDAAVGSGATTVRGLRFDVKRRDAIEREALQMAVADAMGRAEAMASGARRAIDRVIRIEELPVGGGPQPMRMERAMVAGADASTPVAAGEVEVRAEVRVTVAIK